MLNNMKLLHVGTNTGLSGLERCDLNNRHTTLLRSLLKDKWRYRFLSFIILSQSCKAKTVPRRHFYHFLTICVFYMAVTILLRKISIEVFNFYCAKQILFKFLIVLTTTISNFTNLYNEILHFS